MESAASTCDGGRQEDEDEKLKRECWEEKQALGRVIFALHGYHEGTVCVCVCVQHTCFQGNEVAAESVRRINA